VNPLIFIVLLFRRRVASLIFVLCFVGCTNDAGPVASAHLIPTWFCEED